MDLALERIPGAHKLECHRDVILVFLRLLSVVLLPATPFLWSDLLSAVWATVLLRREQCGGVGYVSFSLSHKTATSVLCLKTYTVSGCELLEAIEARSVILGKDDLACPRHMHCRLLQLVPAAEEEPGLDSHFDERRAYVERGAAVVSFERAPVC